MKLVGKRLWLLGMGLMTLLLIPNRGWPQNGSGRGPWHHGRYRTNMATNKVVIHGPRWGVEEPFVLARRGGGRGHGGGFIGPGRSDDRIWRQRYREWESLPPEKKRLLKERMEEWKRLTPRERALMRKRYEQWKRLSPEEQIWIRKQLRHWDELSPEEREMIRERFLQ